ncbi:hypothetical protein COCCADRAFT_89515 [Bipolaris zeicola 26-R-13]|uniref:Uncharacterized protein n=1 Tax=Cochliobolus carbonum (strain 26-R-13) TaxID=930089 RepID=W6Y8I4_COCC2|nr:uncharacterized protein COCCADRAFT_89515 [Bipolaris zeicola 26-R-13]EUC35937.1 hypothetical protein COCCADRAFT_89515 [Bipolaris zeicola 26-R-13]
MADSINPVKGERPGKTEKHLQFDINKPQVTSPPYTGSGDTLHDNEAWDDYSNLDDKATLSGSGSPGSFNLEGLSIADEHPRSHQRSGKGHNHPVPRGPRYPNVNRHGPPGRGFHSHHRQGAANARRGGSTGFRNPNPPLGPDAQMHQDFLTVRNSMRRQFKNSDVAKWKFGDYVAHREAMAASEANKLTHQAKAKEEAGDYSSAISPATQAFLRRCGLNGNFDEVGNSGRALGEQTIWCKDWQNGKEEVAPWPSYSEMRWEGDDRAKTGVGRFLPLPREPGPPGLTWSQLPVIEQYPMDQVCQIPTMEDVYLPVDPDIEPDHEYLWSKELEKEMDALLES